MSAKTMTATQTEIKKIACPRCQSGEAWVRNVVNATESLECTACGYPFTSEPVESEEEAGEVVKCDVCDAEETILGEVSAETLEGEGWYLGLRSNLCPEHNEEGDDESALA